MRKFIEQNKSKGNFALVEFKRGRGGVEPGFELLDDGKEIRFNDVMYDVVSKQVIDGEEVYSCIADHDETHLLSELKEQLVKNTSSFPFSKEATSLVLSFFSQNYLPAQLSILLKSSEELKPQSFLYTEISSVFHPETNSPPPKPAA